MDFIRDAGNDDETIARYKSLPASPGRKIRRRTRRGKERAAIPQPSPSPLKPAGIQGLREQLLGVTISPFGVKRKLKNEPTIFEVAEPFIQKIKQGTLLVIEFVAPLSRFCKAIVDWYDESQLLELTGTKAIKNTLEEFKSTIISRNVKIENPLEWFNFYMDDINDSHSRFKILVEALLRQAEQATIELDNNDDTGQSSRARTIDESFPSKIDVADRKGSPPRRFLDSESESDESDDDAHPFRSGQKRPARNQSSPAIEDEEKKQPGSFARKSRRSTSKIPKSEFETDTPKLWKDESESEEVQQEAASRAIEESKANLMSTYELGADVLGDLWITHELIKSSIHFVVTDKIKEQNFKLPKIDHLTHPRSHLTNELSIVIEIQIENNQILDDPQDYFKLTINRNALLVHKTHLEGSTLRMIIPVNPDFLKLGSEITESDFATNTEDVERKDNDWIVTMLQPIRSDRWSRPNRPDRRGIIRCPVRGTGCGHVQCFELFGYIQRNKCKSDWICPVPTVVNLADLSSSWNSITGSSVIIEPLSIILLSKVVVILHIKLDHLKNVCSIKKAVYA
ncbi:hypothetical protein KEM48_010426 [Puccinia striiformis f. sp. tritici PST-130]|nr:hypothetical protein KEM48_010426 [Puccinia striiformis f. sp. tritici PST-130]